MFELVSPGAHLWLLDVDAASHVRVLNLLFKALMLCAFTTFAGRLFQKSTTRWVKVCNKSQLISLNSFRIWPRSPVEVNVKNLEKSMSLYLFRILNTCNISALSLLNWSVGMPKVVSLMLYG